jgi:hypothetical protein
VAEIVEAAAEREEELPGMVVRLQAALLSVPESHFARLAEALDARLAASGGGGAGRPGPPAAPSA